MTRAHGEDTLDAKKIVFVSPKSFGFSYEDTQANEESF